MKASSLVGGLAGACALTLINQVVSKIDKDAPRLDLLGMNAVAKFVKSPTSSTPLVVRKLFPISLAGDLISNSLYYAMAGGNSRNARIAKGLLLGLGAGIGAVTLSKPIAGDSSSTNRTTKTQILTIAWYVLGGLVAGLTIDAIEGSDDTIPEEAKVRLASEQRVLAGI